MTDPSNALSVDSIVLPMAADKSDIDDPIRIVDPHNDPILVARYIEDYPTISKDTRAANIPLDVGWLRPVCLSDLPIPGHHWLTSIGYAFAAADKRLDRAECYNPHGVILP
jgi:hypothetical protein